MLDDLNDDYRDIRWLMSHSEIHKDYTQHQINRGIWPSLHYEQYRIFRDDDNRPVCYISWAFLDDEASEAFRYKRRDLQPEEWRAGHHIWIVNMIAPFGGVLGFIRKMQKIHKLAQQQGAGICVQATRSKSVEGNLRLARYRKDFGYGRH